MTTKVKKILEYLNEQLIKAFKNSYSFLSGKKVFIYGSGVYGKALLNKLIEFKFVDNICAFINDFEHGFEIEGIPVKSFDECVFSGDYCIVVAIEKQEKVVKKLKDQGLTFYVPSRKQFILDVNLFWNKPSIDNLAERIKFYHNNTKMYEKFLTNFYTDEESKRVIQNRIDFYNTGNLDCLYNNRITLPQYFNDDCLKLSDKEVFIDCGAFNGDSVENFVLFTKGRYKKIVSFEPDTHNFAVLENVAKAYHDVEIYPFATGNKNCEVCFSEKSDVSSSVSEEGGARVRMVRLDDFIKDIPTFIKMDIEGAELDTIKGAENLIKIYHPKLAICIYHKVEDLYTIPTYLKSLVPEYKMKVRQHCSGIYETVLYAEV